MEYNPSQQNPTYSAFPGNYNPDHSAVPNQTTFQAVGHTQGGWMHQQQATSSGSSTFTPNSWEAQQELDSLLGNPGPSNAWAPPPTLVNLDGFSARNPNAIHHPTYSRSQPFQNPGVSNSTTSRRWNNVYSNGSGPERVSRPRIVYRVYRHLPNTASRLQYSPVDHSTSHTTPVTNTYPQSTVLNSYSSPHYTAITEPPSSYPPMTASSQPISTAISQTMVQTDLMNPAPVPSTSGTTIPPNHPIHAVVPHNSNETNPSELVQLQSYAPSRASTSTASPTSTTPKQPTRDLPLDKQINEFFPLGTPDVEGYRSKLRTVMTSSWLHENRMEPKPELLLDFMEKVGKKWLCRFYVNGERCHASSSEREVQALEHVRRHIGLKPFVCEGPCPGRPTGCQRRYASPDPLTKHQQVKVPCESCGAELLIGNLSRHQKKHCRG